MLLLVRLCPLNLQVARTVLYNPTTFNEWQKHGEFCYSFALSTRHDMANDEAIKGRRGLGALFFSGIGIVERYPIR